MLEKCFTSKTKHCINMNIFLILSRSIIFHWYKILNWQCVNNFSILLVCSSPPLGMQDGRILNHQLTASSDGMWLNLKTFEAKDARLRLASLSWVSAILDSSPWLQVSFAPEIKIISAIATQGNPSYDWWTTSYTLKHSMTGKIWRYYEKEGVEVNKVNTDKIGCIARVMSI